MHSKNSHTFVHTNIVDTKMTIEEIIKSNQPIPLPKKTVLNILCTQNILGERFNEILKPHDLSSEQFNVLRILRGQKGKAVNMSDIQERMIAKTSNTTRLIDKLLLKEMVSRQVCPENRRKIEVSITPKGLDTLQELDSKVEGFENSMQNTFTKEELELLNQFLDRIRH